MIRMLGVGVLLSQQRPRPTSSAFDIEATCRAAPRLLPTDPNPYPSCVRDETEARSQLERQWASFNVRQREECVRASSIQGTPSFVDVLTCLQMAGGMPASFPRSLPQP